MKYRGNPDCIGNFLESLPRIFEHRLRLHKPMLGTGNRITAGGGNKHIICQEFLYYGQMALFKLDIWI